MSGPCKYHSNGTNKASHSTRDCTLNDKRAKEKNGKMYDDADGDDDGTLPPSAYGSGTQGRGTDGAE